MKKVIILVLMFIGLKAYSQIPMEGKYEFNNAVYFDDSLKLDRVITSVDDSMCVYRDGTNGRLFYGTCPTTAVSGLWESRNDSVTKLIDSTKTIVINGNKYLKSGFADNVPQLVVMPSPLGGGKGALLQLLSNNDSYLGGELYFNDQTTDFQIRTVGGATDKVIVDLIKGLNGETNTTGLHNYVQGKAFAATMIFDTLNVADNDTVISINFETAQAYHVRINSAITGIKIEINNINQLNTGYIQDLSISIECPIAYAAPTLFFTAGQFQFIKGLNPSLTTTNLEAIRKDVLNFRYDGSPLKVVKVFATTDFRNN